MHRFLMFLLVGALAAGSAFAHGGKSHRLLGTVKELHESHMVVTATDGHEVHVALTAETQYQKEGKAATRSDLATGLRVSIQLTEDEKTALKVRIGQAAAR